MDDDSSMLLGHPWKEPRHIFESHERDVECVAEPDEPGPLPARVDVEDSCQDSRLIRDHPDGTSPEARKPRDQVGSPARVNLEEASIINDRTDHVVHVVRLSRHVGHDIEQAFVSTIDRVVRLPDRRRLCVVRRQIGKELPDRLETIDFGGPGKMRYAGGRRVDARAAQLLEAHILVRNRFHHVGPGDEHVADSLDHEHEVRDRGRVDGTARARAQDGADLGNDTGGHRVSPEQLGISAERRDSLLDPSTSGIVQADHRRSVSNREIYHLADLLGVRLGQRATEHGEVLAEHVDRPPVNGAVSCHDTVSGDPLPVEPEFRGPVLDESIQFDE